MKVFRDLASASVEACPRAPRVATVGFFDGLHIGHHRLLGDLKAWAAATGSEPAVVTFDRHPQEVLTGRGPIRILSLEHRLLLLAREGIAAALVLSFDRALSQWSAEEFVSRVVVDALGGRRLLMGFDSTFGRGKKGTFEHLSAKAGSLRIEVRQAGAERLDGERVSSTLVREAIQAGDLARLERLLGRRFSLVGRVLRGDGRGRTIGVPTANLDVLGSALPPSGVYFAEVSRLGGSLEAALDAGKGARARPDAALEAVVNIGKRPTFKDPSIARDTVEAHLVDWSGDLYGEILEVHLLRWHREERRFRDAEALVKQIRADVQAFKATGTDLFLSRDRRSF